ncbi:hypothetical protein ACHRVW_02855 [Flavobacterium collinsii]|uniref:Uncharacterized protein n=1 Tax=Flavobacterium collinsii TaxID=1114861 RepID=A0ABM8KG56_9FLAO|nr:hypothetical protein [Flavobacterium collinsii]CAA9196877.1 hypothetical protein FLACOL7796_01365 [Flavobacterium collinsii]
MDKHSFLIKNVFIGLENLNNGFDSESIYYFSENDFEIVLDRVEKLGVEILGIEPWKNGAFYDVITNEDFNSDLKWYRKAFIKFKESGENLQYAASYKIPSELLV